MSISFEENNLKLWNINNSELLLDMKNINKDGMIRSSCFLRDKGNIYIITSNFNYYYSFNIEPIKVFDINGNKIKEINNSKDITFFICNYFDNKFNKNYIMTANSGNAKSYDYTENKIYFKYSDNEKIYRIYHNIIIDDNEDIIKFIALSNDGYIRFWNFHSGELLKKIFIKSDNLLAYNMLCSICLWNKEFLFIGCSDNIIKLVEINSGEIIKNLFGHNSEVSTIKKIILPQYGECLISQSNEEIKLWINKN